MAGVICCERGPRYLHAACPFAHRQSLEVSNPVWAMTVSARAGNLEPRRVQAVVEHLGAEEILAVLDTVDGEAVRRVPDEALRASHRRDRFGGRQGVASANR